MGAMNMWPFRKAAAKTVEEEVVTAHSEEEAIRKLSSEARPQIIRGEKDDTFTLYALSEGAVVQRSDYTATTWDTNQAIWSDPIPADPKEKIKKAVKYCERDPIVHKSIGILADLSNDTFRIASDDAQVEAFFKGWWTSIGGAKFQDWFFHELYRSGNVPILKSLIPYSPSAQFGAPNSKAKSFASESVEAGLGFIKTLASAQSSDEDIANAAAVWKGKSIPGAYTILDPLTVEFTGPKVTGWFSLMSMRADQDFITLMQKPPKELAALVKTLPPEIMQAIKKGANPIPLPDYLATMVCLGKLPYEQWATPLCTHAFEALDYKYELRAMDKATVRGVRNRILKVTIGSDKFPCTDGKKIKDLAATFNNPSRNLTIFWNHTLDIKYIEPNLDSLNMAKYEPTDEEIRSNFGVAKVLLGGDGGAIGNNILNLKGLIETVTGGQNLFVGWFRQESERICQVMGFKTIPDSSFNVISLKDENQFIRLLETLVDRQIISYQTMVENIGYYFPRELDRLKKEKKIRERDGILIPTQAPTQMSDKKSADPQQDAGNPTGDAGRPPTSVKEAAPRDNQGQPRAPKGGK
jgi:hypothetical protein